jgi:hypothetical protein
MFFVEYILGGDRMLSGRVLGKEFVPNEWRLHFIRIFKEMPYCCTYNSQEILIP